ncbi:valine--tRNA ligase [Candidatus Wolfebacteria bacterium]|uniref:Valine--tRNA ligase n=2 Tax=Candidatus Wolfeibacteriota TaxID=1752735 RepID=A0A2M7Q780_9BACT|nr:valine--tRNA ligase [Parcubacteria group bacterium]NCP58318.1 valine--tRNA ligase [Candidatus Wolfebacteria bacterium]NCQ02493.1 valine--tRNA ligase [Candidatus Wolfebacteria bacterium]PIU99010.1 MAG: valine--tRNA ligase [Candidatus Wolfebacteria bacterium CG03_land_8_20_14_0_80_39_317]PIY58972.1 MAG: valine--tRNA ligase [Candidatus Wolfebacteria bacterium CG_4_10_14_0_8_um_filter_39_64]
MKRFDKPYDPKEVEDKIYRLWEKSGYFNPDKLPDKKGKTFSIVVPPPNVTGSLHLGHALNATIQDILIRKKRMEGYKTLWLPGTDHAGIATQNVVEKDLKKQGISRHDLGREKLIEKIWEWKEKYGYIILDQFKKLGCSMDWSRTRFTMDSDYQEAVKETFLHYHKKGWIYQAERVINWCIRCGTSLSDLEVELKDTKSKLWFIKYSPDITVATTRPETMLGDTAVAVHPNDKRYKNLIGEKVILPIQNRKIAIIADKRVDPKFGTGAIKVTPAHSFTDFEIGQEHNLEIIKVIGQDGKMSEQAGKNFEGLTVLQAREKVVQGLEKQGLIKKVEDYNNYVGHCYRCGTVIEPIPSLQWFLKMNELANTAIQAVKSGKVKFHPKRWEKIYFNWLNNIKDWCISRQIWWGHRLPVYKNLEIYVGDNPPKDYIQIPDVLDTWFSSALWPFATLGWPKRTADLKEFYPTQILVTARDIINLWVARMIFSGLKFTKKEPFKDVIIHATILTKEGKRMSKSLGTGVDPMDLISRYGADAVRFGLIWQAMGNQDIRWSEEHVVAGQKFCNKIWNSARFALLQILNSIITKQIPRGSFQISKTIKPKTTADKKILNQLTKIKKSTEKDLDNYRFGQALHKLYEFFWHNFCDKYIEISKKQMADDKLQKNTQEILIYILLSSLKLLHPFMPFITEEIYQQLPIKNKKMLMIEKW